MVLLAIVALPKGVKLIKLVCKPGKVPARDTGRRRTLRTKIYYYEKVVLILLG